MDPESEVVIVTNVYGDVCIRKARRKRQKLLVRELFLDYANNTTLHGLPYVSRKGLTLIEKLFWLITFLASVSMCLFLISKVWFKWQTSPVIVTVSEQPVPVSMVPFPSVTICPQSKCKATVYNYTAQVAKINEYMENKNVTLNSTMMDEVVSRFYHISQVCFDYSDYEDEMSSFYNHKYFNSSVFEDILNVAPSFRDVFFYCKVRGADAPCQDLFNMVVTNEGICYNMNSLAYSQIFRTDKLHKDYLHLYGNRTTEGWSIETGYDVPSTSDYLVGNVSYYPRPGSENGASPDVEVVLIDTLGDRDHICNALNSGFKVYAQHPADLPQSSLYYYAILNSQLSSMALSFSILNTSESLRGYDPEIRQCYFPDERYLKFFNLYTASNCRVECLSNITLEICGCVMFYMPHAPGIKLCSDPSNPCPKKAREQMLRQESTRDISKCHCLPSCNSVDYEAEILKTDFNLKQFYKTVSTLSNVSSDALKGVKFSKLEMYYKQPRFLSMRRSELFGLIDFLANCGGLLGLFLGFSFLSLVELFYFLTLRLCCTLKKDLEEEKSKNDQGNGIHVEKY